MFKIINDRTEEVHAEVIPPCILITSSMFRNRKLHDVSGESRTKTLKANILMLKSLTCEHLKSLNNIKLSNSRHNWCSLKEYT